MLISEGWERRLKDLELPVEVQQLWAKLILCASLTMW
jgi:hypothetical protein